jgi:hypothetical protein
MLLTTGLASWVRMVPGEGSLVSDLRRAESSMAPAGLVLLFLSVSCLIAART